MSKDNFCITENINIDLLIDVLIVVLKKKVKTFLFYFLI